MNGPSEIVVQRTARLRVGLGAVVVLVVIGLGIAALVSALGSHGTSQVVTAPTAVSTDRSAPGGGGAGSVFVHILGAVAKPGLYLLTDGARAIDAVAAAGGFAPTADQAQLNLARPLVDGEQIVVPEVGQEPAASAQAPGESGGKVNLNTADATTLETLPRVGPAMSARIIQWRTTNGRFTAVEDLMSVTGVGDKTFEQLKDLVTV